MACAKFLATLEVSEARRGIGVTMMEEFVDRARHLLRGTTDLAMPQKAGSHGDKAKFGVFGRGIGIGSSILDAATRAALIRLLSVA